MQIIDKEYEEWTQKEFIKYCERMGIELFIPDDNTLILDLDSSDAVTALGPKLDRLNEMMAFNGNCVSLTEIRPSTTPSHFHAYLRIQYKLDIVSRVGCQMFLGSDPVKELLSMQRIQAGIEPATLLALGNWKGTRR
jgi:hypothetical protein